MTNVVNFNETFEKDLIRVGAETEQVKRVPSSESLPEREIVRESIRSLAGQAEPAAEEPETAGNDTGAASMLPSYLTSDDANPAAKNEVQYLIDLAEKKGIMHALAIARNRSPFTEDAFHDALVEKIVPEMKKRGLLK